MATLSSVLAWRIPGTGEPGGLPSLELHRVGHDWSDLAAAWKIMREQSLLIAVFPGWNDNTPSVCVCVCVWTLHSIRVCVNTPIRVCVTTLHLCVCVCVYIHTYHLRIIDFVRSICGFPGGASGKEPTCQCRRRERRGFDPWVRRSPGGGHGNPTPVFLPGESYGQGTWQAAIHGVATSWTRLKRLHTHTHIFMA